MKFLTKREILEMINTKVNPYGMHLNDKEEPSEWTTIRKLYGPQIQPLNPKIAQLAIGKRIYGLSGQQLMYPESRKEKLKQVERLKIHGFGKDADASTSYKTTFDEYDSILVSFERTGGPYEVYKCTSASDKLSLWGTGSGCDTVYVFVKKHGNSKK